MVKLHAGGRDSESQEDMNKIILGSILVLSLEEKLGEVVHSIQSWQLDPLFILFLYFIFFIFFPRFTCPNQSGMLSSISPP